MTQVLAPLTQIPSDIVAVQDYEPYAQPRMSPQAWAYFSGGVADEQLLEKNRSSFSAYTILPRVLRNLSQGHTRLRLLGREYDFPIFLAPVAYQRLAHVEGELASAVAAAAMQTPFIISMQSSVNLQTLAQQAPGPKWLQWYWQPDQAASQRLLSQAVDCGVEALVLTVDAPVNGQRNREQRVGFGLPPDIQAVHLLDFNQVKTPVAQPGKSPLFGTGFLEHSPTWEQVAQFIAHSPLPVFLKGVLHPLDAQQAVLVGAAGLIVSNHGGRVLDTVPTALQMLPHIVQAIDDQIPVLMDGGIRRGSDVFTALALGAKAVLIGRPYVYALAAAGAPGVAHVLHMLRTELELTMVLAGCATLEQIQSQCLLPS